MMSDLINNKKIATELARSIYSKSQDGAYINELVEQLTGALPKHNEPSGLSEITESDPDMVGIWKKEIKNNETYYVRDPRMKNDWALWVQSPIIPPKSSKTRIVLLGESVARGYLYDPYYYPSDVLEQILNGSGLMNCEVIDLARTNLNLTNLSELSVESLKLNPDAILIFAGNNWFYSVKKALNTDDIFKMSEILTAKGMEGVKDYILVKFKQAIEKYLAFLSEVSRSRNIPIVFVIPEFNLLDWKSSETEKIMTKLSNNNLKLWIKTKEKAEQALLENEWELAFSLAEKMIEIDCSHPTGFEIAGNSKLKLGLKEEARKYLEAARDSSLFNRSYTTPRIYSVVRETLLEQADEHGIKVVDLPEIFLKSKDGLLPGRELFLDYCHLSEEGIQIAMAAVAQELIYNISGKKVAAKDLDAERFKVEGEVKSAAYICAAVHNAHYGQTHDILGYLCDEALKASLAAAEIMVNFVDFATRRTSTALCKSHEKLVENEFINQYDGGRGFINKNNHKIMDILLVEAMINSLEKVGIDIREKTNQLRKKEHGVNYRKINLLEPFYHSSAYDVYSGKKMGYFQSRNLNSEFFLVAESNTAVNLKITYRTPDRDHRSDKVNIYVNGIALKTLFSTERWETHHVSIPPGELNDGLNIIRINWSTNFEFKKTTKEVDLSEDYILSKLYSVYGEISTFTATVI